MASSGHTVWVVSAEGTIIEVAGYLADQLGYPREELRGLPIEELIYPDDWPLVARKFTEVVGQLPGGSSVTAEFRIAGRVGGSYEVKVVANARRREDGETEVIAFSTDITRQRIVERSLSRERARFMSAFEHAPGGIVLLHIDPSRGALVKQANQVACRIAGRSSRDVTGRWIPADEMLEVDQEDIRDAGRKAVAMFDGGADGFEVQWPIIRPDGSRLCVKGAVSMLESRDPEPRSERRPVNAIAHIEDVTERRRTDLKLRFQAQHDSLTGLLNRRHFMELLGDRIERAAAGLGGGAILMIDLDDFKHVNDTYGHVTGDRVLREVAQILKDGLRDGDSVARLGGDEFAVLLTRTDLAGARSVANSLLGHFAAARSGTNGTEHQGYFPSVSIGVTVIDGEEADAEAALRASDDAMYEAKRDGGGRFVSVG